MTIRKILIADDDVEDGEFFAMAVHRIDPSIQVEVAGDTDELYSSLSRSLPDLLFIDSYLRQDSGHAAITAIRSEQRFQSLPVIMYTGAGDADSIRRAFEAGASCYVVKPHTLKEMEAVLRQLLGRNWSQMAPVQQYYTNRHFEDYRIPV